MTVGTFTEIRLSDKLFVLFRFLNFLSFLPFIFIIPLVSDIFCRVKLLALLYLPSYEDK